MESLNFPVAAPVAAPIKFAWIGWSGAITQECKAVRGFSCAIVVATLAGAIALSGTVSGAEAPLTLAEAQRLAVERSRQVSAQNAAVAASRWLDELGDPYTRTGADLDGRVGIDWGVHGVPETFVVDKRGVIRHKAVGAITRTMVDERLMPLVRRLQSECAVLASSRCEQGSGYD
jgi:hypothetical protein